MSGAASCGCADDRAEAEGVVVIPTSVRPERMAENLDVFDHRDPDLVRALGSRRIT